MINIPELTTAWLNLDAVAHDAISPITQEDQYDRALATLETLLKEVGEEPHPLDGLINQLTQRIALYEEHKFPIGNASPQQMLAYLMDSRRMSQSALALATGVDQGNLSKLLHGKREFTTEHIRKLSAYFQVDPSLFIS